MATLSQARQYSQLQRCRSTTARYCYRLSHKSCDALALIYVLRYTSKQCLHTSENCIVACACPRFRDASSQPMLFHGIYASERSTFALRSVLRRQVLGAIWRPVRHPGTWSQVHVGPAVCRAWGLPARVLLRWPAGPAVTGYSNMWIHRTHQHLPLGHGQRHSRLCWLFREVHLPPAVTAFLSQLLVPTLRSTCPSLYIRLASSQRLMQCELRRGDDLRCLGWCRSCLFCAKQSRHCQMRVSTSFTTPSRNWTPSLMCLIAAYNTCGRRCTGHERTAYFRLECCWCVGLAGMRASGFNSSPLFFCSFCVLFQLLCFDSLDKTLCIHSHSICSVQLLSPSVHTGCEGSVPFG